MDEIQFGATGDFPQGKMNSDDHGGLVIGIAHCDGKVVIDFGDTMVKWVGFDPDTGRALADLIYLHCRAVETEGPSTVEPAHER